MEVFYTAIDHLEHESLILTGRSGIIPCVRIDVKEHAKVHHE